VDTFSPIDEFWTRDALDILLSRRQYARIEIQSLQSAGSVVRSSVSGTSKHRKEHHEQTSDLISGGGGVSVRKVVLFRLDLV
jgi:hypothetical protein